MGIPDDMHGHHDVDLVAQPGVLNGCWHPTHGAEQTGREVAAIDHDYAQLEKLTKAVAFGMAVMPEELQNDWWRSSDKHEAAF